MTEALAWQGPRPARGEIWWVDFSPSVEESYRGKHKRYTRLDVLKERNQSPVGEGEREPNSGYLLRTLAANREHYTITATPTDKDLHAYTMGQSGEVLGSP